MTRDNTYQKPLSIGKWRVALERHLKELRLDHNHSPLLFEKNKSDRRGQLSSMT